MTRKPSKRIRIAGGILLLACAIGAQALRLFANDALAWLPPATIAATWLCLLGGAALIVSVRNDKGAP